MQAPPERALDLFKILEAEGWQQHRVTGSHFIFRKPNCRSIPVAVHDNKVRPALARLVLKQARRTVMNAEEGSVDTTVERPPSAIEQVSDPVPPAFLRAPTVSTLQATPEPNVVEERQQQTVRAQEDSAQSQRLLLERAELLVTSGEYASAVKLFAGLDFALDFALNASGTNNRYESAQDIMFFRMVAICEHAKSMEINTPPHLAAVEEVFHQSRGFLERFPDRREEARAYLISLKQHIFTTLWEELGRLAQKETSIKNLGDTAVMDMAPDAIATLMFARLAAPSVDRVELSDEAAALGQRVMSSVVDGFIFIMQLKGTATFPLLHGPSDGGLMAQFLNGMQGFGCLNTCLRQVFIWYDAGKYDQGYRLASLMQTFVDENKEAIRLFELMPMGFTFGNQPPARSSLSEYYKCVLELVRTLHDPYVYALNEFSWKRFNGIEYGLHDLPDNGASPTWAQLFHFLDAIMPSIVFVRKNHLVLNQSASEHFTIETLYDPLMLIAKQAYRMLSSSGDKRVCSVLKRMFKSKSSCGDEFMQSNSHDMHALRRQKYDPLRSNTLRLELAMISITEAFSAVAQSSSLVIHAAPTKRCASPYGQTSFTDS